MNVSSSEVGTATVLAAVSVGMSVGLSFLLIATVVAMGIRVEIGTAADAAALAAVGAAVIGDDPCAAAKRLAVANGARLMECQCPDFVGGPLAATVVVGRFIEVPILGEQMVQISASAEYRPDT